MRQQYESVFSQPIEKKQIIDPDQFFGIPHHHDDQEEEDNHDDDHHDHHLWREAGRGQEDEECHDCKVEKVHICPTDPRIWYQIFPRDKMNIVDEMNCISTPPSPPTGEVVPKSQTPEIENSYFDYTDVTLAIEDIPSGASPGPDGVPPCILKRAKVNISRMLVVVFKSSMESGEIPEVLKLAFVTPVHKGGSRAQPVQYRPISLTSHVIKVLERVLRKSLVGFLEWQGKMDPNQHGSRSQRSCLSQLLEHHEEILRMLESGENVDAIYLDFLKAFDKVDIGILIRKAKLLGITGKLGRWVNCFLSGRQQIVIVNGRKSQISDVISGVSQGTVLGPLLFLIYISDISIGVKANMKVYVDDTKLKKGVESENSVEELQKDLNTLYKWASDNNMTFNGSKFQLMRYGKNEELKQDTLYFTDEMENVIEQYESLKDLGVYMNDKADFSTNVTNVVKKAKKNWVGF